VKTVTANYKPTPITFEATYDVSKIRRLAQQVTDLGNQLGSVATAASGGSLPSGGSNGEVLTWDDGPEWAAAPIPATYPWVQLTGVPTTFPTGPFNLATPAGLGPLPQISGASPGMVLLATGSSSGKLGYLDYSQLGDVDITGIADGYVPAWSNVTNKWEMVPNGISLSGLTPGYVYTATSPTTAQFLQVTFSQIGGETTPAQIGTGTPSYGAGDPRTPLKTTAGNATLWKEMNQSTAYDTLLTGDGYWTAIRDLEISWSQISDIPPQVTPYTGVRKQYLAGDQTWQTLPTPLTIQQVFSLPGDDGAAGDDGFTIVGPTGPQGPQGPSGSGSGGQSGIIWPDDGAPGDDGLPIPGIQGVPGSQGIQGGQGPWMHADDGNTGDDGQPIPGIQGAPGASGATGSPGFGAIILPDDPQQGDDGIPMPGIQGAPGTAGVAGFPSIHLWADDGNTGDDGQPIPGVQGAQGVQGIQGSPSIHFWADDGNPADDGISVPGIQGAQGLQGPSGFPSIHLWADDGNTGDDGQPIQGSQGAAGAPGATGSPGFGAIILPDDPQAGDDGISVPGIQGAPGLQGIAGFPSIHLWADDGNTGDDGQPIPGLQGPVGAAGNAGAAGMASVIFPDDPQQPDDAIPIIGPRGPIGTQGFMPWSDDGNTGDDGMPIPGIQGATGPQGQPGTGGGGGSSIVIPGDDGNAGDDGWTYPQPGPYISNLQMVAMNVYIYTHGGGGF
jgi:hypothetical protein